jgi:hypothetical protein
MGFVTRRVLLVEQEFFCGMIRIAQSNLLLCSVLWIIVCLFVFWSLYCLSFNLRLLITPLIFSNSSIPMESPGITRSIVARNCRIIVGNHQVNTDVIARTKRI